MTNDDQMVTLTIPLSQAEELIRMLESLQTATRQVRRSSAMSRARVLQALKGRRKPVTRSSLVELTGGSKRAIHTACDDLLRAEKLIETPEGLKLP